MTTTVQRAPEELRPVKMELDYVIYPEGSVLISMGRTRVLCNATVEETLPPWLKYSKNKHGWVTAEYAMLPRATEQRPEGAHTGDPAADRPQPAPSGRPA
jgi:ribonuclease PH